MRLAIKLFLELHGPTLYGSVVKSRRLGLVGYVARTVEANLLQISIYEIRAGEGRLVLKLRV
jgi:hypothetical protein